LQTDHLDLYLIHAPMPGMDPHQIMHDLNRLVREGKTRYVGCSNYPAWLVSHSNCIAEREGWAQLVCNQIPYSLIERGVEVEILPQSYAENIATMAYRPLAMGVLSGKYVPSQQPPQDSRAVADARIPRWLDRYSTQISAFLKMADTVGVTPVALALGWVRACPAITSPVVGASSLQQLESHLKAFEFSLTHEQYTQLNEIFAATEPWEEVSVADFRDWRRNLGLVKR